MSWLTSFLRWLTGWLFGPHSHDVPPTEESEAMWQRMASEANAKRIALEKENKQLTSDAESLRGEVAILQQQLDDCEQEITDGRPRNFPDSPAP